VNNTEYESSRRDSEEKARTTAETIRNLLALGLFFFNFSTSCI